MRRAGQDTNFSGRLKITTDAPTASGAEVTRMNISVLKSKKQAVAMFYCRSPDNYSKQPPCKLRSRQIPQVAP
jgi:hypothetical protein